MGAAGSNTIMGVSIVFFVLVSLSFLIYLFRFISIIEEQTYKKEDTRAGKRRKSSKETSPRSKKKRI